MLFGFSRSVWLLTSSVSVVCCFHEGSMFQVLGEKARAVVFWFFVWCVERVSSERYNHRVSFRISGQGVLERPGWS